LTENIYSITISLKIITTGFDEEEYMYSGNKEKGCWWKFPVNGTWKVAPEP
jgi:hypothetical protein